VRSRDSFDDWTAAITVLHGWGVLTDELAEKYRQLEGLRHQAVHYTPSVAAAEREPALTALRLLQEIIEGIFSPLGGPPHYIEDTPGASFFALEAEQLPLIKRVFLPRAVLVSPAHRLDFRPEGDRIVMDVYDDADYDPRPLSDAEFAAALTAGIASMHPECAAESPAGQDPNGGS
jgi:hypothetical protein